MGWANLDGADALCPVELNGRSLLASGGYSGTVRLWDPATGEPVQVMTVHTSWVRALCPVELNGRSQLASGGWDRTVRLWDLTADTPVLTIPVHIPAYSLVALGSSLIVGLERGIVSITLSPGLLGRMGEPLEALIGSAPGLSAATDLDALRDEWER